MATRMGRFRRPPLAGNAALLDSVVAAGAVGATAAEVVLDTVPSAFLSGARTEVIRASTPYR